MADKDIFGVAEDGAWSTDAPNPNVELSGTSPSSISINQLFTDAMSDTETATVTILKDADNWKVYKGAILVTGTPNELDLTSATLLDSVGTISDTDTVEVYGLAPSTFVTAPSTPTSAGVSGQTAWSSPYLYSCVAPDTWVRFTPMRTW